jgi:hypothetical protein
MTPSVSSPSVAAADPPPLSAHEIEQLSDPTPLRLKVPRDEEDPRFVQSFEAEVVSSSSLSAEWCMLNHHACIALISRIPKVYWVSFKHMDLQWFDALHQPNVKKLLKKFGDY